jgi:hypothetical protein
MEPTTLAALLSIIKFVGLSSLCQEKTRSVWAWILHHRFHSKHMDTQTVLLLTSSTQIAGAKVTSIKDFHPHQTNNNTRVRCAISSATILAQLLTTSIMSLIWAWERQQHPLCSLEFSTLVSVCLIQWWYSRLETTSMI